MVGRLKVKHARSPNLATIRMVESFLKSQKQPVSIPSLKKGIPKQVMHQTLKLILQYLWESKKIEYTPEGIIWVFEER